jgi:outer membrane lipoprotein SlyB
MRAPILAAAALTMIPLAGCATNDPFGSYDGYYERYYRPGRYDPYPLGRDDYVYRGNDDRYYCRRPDGTVGLVVGAGVGGVLGNLIAPRGSRTLGSILGAAGGAAVGYAIERGEVRCE